MSVKEDFPVGSLVILDAEMAKVKEIVGSAGRLPKPEESSHPNLSKESTLYDWYLLKKRRADLKILLGNFFKNNNFN